MDDVAGREQRVAQGVSCELRRQVVAQIGHAPTAVLETGIVGRRVGSHQAELRRRAKGNVLIGLDRDLELEPLDDPDPDEANTMLEVVGDRAPGHQGDRRDGRRHMNAVEELVRRLRALVR